MASKTPKSNLTSPASTTSKPSKTTASKAATKKPVAKKAAAARGPAVAAEPPAPEKKAAKKTVARKAAATTTAPAKSAAKAAAAKAPATKASTTKASTAKAAAKPAAAEVDERAAQPAAPVKAASRKASSRRAATKDTPDAAASVEAGAVAVTDSAEPAVTAAVAVEPTAPAVLASEPARASEPAVTLSSAAEASAAAPPARAAEPPAPASAAPPAPAAEARNGHATDAPADAAEDRRPRVLRRAGAGKPARPAVKPSWETYPEPLQALVDAGRRMLGIDNLRPGQAEALVHIMNRRDLLAVMPTGSGKSLLYQLPSLMLDGLTVVVSPLIALIKDQLDKMEERGVAVCRFDSTLTVKQRRDAEALVQAPGGKLVFVTPERISDPEFRAFLRTGAGGRGVALFVVDEAHCVSQWGHDFRPSYLTLRKAIEDLGRPPLLATTATAPPHVREDILHQLGMPEAAIVTTTFERPNLHFEVMALPSEEDKLKTLVTLLKRLPRPGVVYCATVKKVEELYESLHRHAIPVARYHGRMGKKDRDTEQERLMDAKDLVMIATNAFGLGVDKANIRYVLHYHVPGSLEAYAQEAGRGGRDGKPSRCVLMFSPDDVAIQEYFLTGTYPSRRQVRAVYKALQIWSPSDEAPPTITNLALSSHVGTQRTRTVLSLLKDEGFVVEREEGAFWLADDRPSDDVLNEKAKQYEARRIADRQRLDALLAYVKTPRCRNQVILEYLGEPEAPPCGRCDNCQRSREAALAAADQAARLEAKATAELNQEWSADSHDRDAEEESKPRRVIRHRVIRIDEPAAAEQAPEQAAAPAAPAGKPGKPAGDEVRPRAAAEDGTAAADERSKRSSNGQMRLPLDPARANGSSVTAAPAVVPIVAPAVAAAVAGSTAAVAPARAGSAASVPASTDATPPWAAPAGPGAAHVAPAADEEGGDRDDDEDDEYIDDEEGDEYIDDEEGDEDEEYEDEDEEYEDEDDEEFEDEDEEEGEEGEDDEEYEDEDDEEYEDEDDEGEEDEDYDDEDFELIEKTAAALAEEGVESDTEITILARKRVEKPRPQKAHDSAAQNDDDASKRRRKRRRRRKKRSMLPPKSAFITPVLSKESEAPVGPSRGRRRKAGPVIEYVRGPMRINMTPVASATPNDVAPSRKKKKRRRRGDEPVYPGMAAAAGNGASAPSAPPSDENSGRKRRRRRRRRKRAGGSMRPMQHEGPVTFFSTQWPASEPGARDEGGRRRRRRKRRGRNGRPGSQGGRAETQPVRPLPPPSSE